MVLFLPIIGQFNEKIYKHMNDNKLLNWCGTVKFYLAIKEAVRSFIGTTDM